MNLRILNQVCISSSDNNLEVELFIVLDSKVFHISFDIHEVKLNQLTDIDYDILTKKVYIFVYITYTLTLPL